MSYRRWMDNAFWETDEKKELNCILEMEDDMGRVTPSTDVVGKT